MIIVTGCSGFIASRVCTMLLDAGEEVYGVDNMNDAYAPELKKWRLEQLIDRPQFKFLEADISKPEIQDIEFNETPKALLNLAARAGVRQSVENPWVFYESNCIGTLNMLELCRKLSIPKFVLSSTSSLYGAHKISPFSEDLSTDKPLSPYAASKKAAESLSFSYHHLYDIDITILRYFTVYGPAGRPDMSIFRFARWITEGHSLSVTGAGIQERDFTYVDDVAEGTILAMKPLGYEIINLGSDNPISINQAISKLENTIGKKADIVFEPTHPADIFATWADIDKARKILGWQPSTSFDSGIENVVNWYNSQRSWASTIELGN